MNDLFKYRLEYNQEQGQFHYENENIVNENALWNIVSDNGTIDKYSIFTDFITKKYPYSLSRQEPDDNISFETVREEYEIFDEWYEYYKRRNIIK